MLNKLILAGIIAGALASVPILLEIGPAAVEGEAAGSEQAAGRPRLAVTRPQPAAPRSETLTGRKVRLAADGSGHFSADFSLNGRSVPAMVDTGASVVAINHATARRIGLKLTASDFTGTVDTANGRAKAAGAFIDSVRIGRVEVRNVRAVVLEDRALSGTLIGMSFLSQLRRFQVEGGVLILEQ